MSTLPAEVVVKSERCCFMKAKFSLPSIKATGLSVLALVLSQTVLISSVQAQSNMGLCGQPLPANQTRKLGNQWLTCDGAGAEVLRTPRKIENMEEWTALEFARDRVGMQALRLKEPAPEWRTELSYPVTENWQWTSYHDRDISTCGYDPVEVGNVSVNTYNSLYSDSYKYDAMPITEPIYEDVQHCVQDPEPVSNSGSNYDNGSNYGSGSSGSRYTPPPTNRHETEDSFSGGSSRSSRNGSAGSDYSNKRRDSGSRSLPSSKPTAPPSRRGKRGDNNLIDMTRRPASQTCTTSREQTGSRTIGYRVIYKRPRSCEITHTESRSCGTQKMDFTLRFAKPEASWRPCVAGQTTACDKNYHDILPNKYDLLPGEFEKFYFVSNKGASTTIQPEVSWDPNVTWNKYEVVPTQPIRCQYGANPKLVVEIKTLGRVKRKSPNALMIPVNEDGSKADQSVYVKGNQYVVAGVKGFAYGRPYKVILQDTSNQMIMAAARQSRNLRTEFKLAGDSKVVTDNVKNIGTPQNMGFWKDTQFKITLTELHTLERDVKMTEDLTTNSAKVMSDKDKVIFPLEGEKGVQSLYRAHGPLNALLLNYMGANDSHLTPGNKYRMSVSMYQRGLPFYESGCRNEAECEDEKANNKAFSSAIDIDFVADKRVDERKAVEKLQDWWRAPLWKKLTFTY